MRSSNVSGKDSNNNNNHKLLRWNEAHRREIFCIDRSWYGVEHRLDERKKKERIKTFQLEYNLEQKEIKKEEGSHKFCAETITKKKLFSCCSCAHKCKQTL